MKPPKSFFLILLAGFAVAEPPMPKPCGKQQTDESLLSLERPVIFIPATMGTALVDDTGEMIAWGDFSRKSANGTSDEGRRSLALPMAVGLELGELRDEILPVRVLDTVRVELCPGLSLKAPYYKATLATFHAAAGSESAMSARGGVYVFAYDWRRSGDENAVLLSEFIARVKGDLVRKGKGRQKMDLVAHSGGTQIARYYLRYGGRLLPKDGRLPRLNPKVHEDFANVVLLGPPNAGTLTGLMAAANGHRGHPALPYYDCTIPGSMPGIYQLIPRVRDQALVDPESGASLDPLDFELWVERKWGLANPGNDKALAALLPQVNTPARRREIALDHLKKCLEQSRRFQAALDVQVPKSERFRMMLVMGEGRRTPVVALAYPEKLKRGECRDGDRTVPSYSALHMPYYVKRSGRKVQAGWDAVYRCDFNHDGVANDPECLRSVLGLLASGGNSRAPVKP
jgi:hypothetical protein